MPPKPDQPKAKDPAKDDGGKNTNDAKDENNTTTTTTTPTTPTTPTAIAIPAAAAAAAAPKHTGFTSAQTAAAAVVPVVSVLLIGGLVYWFLKRRKRRSKANAGDTKQPAPFEEKGYIVAKYRTDSLEENPELEDTSRKELGYSTRTWTEIPNLLRPGSQRQPPPAPPLVTNIFKAELEDTSKPRVEPEAAPAAPQPSPKPPTTLNFSRPIPDDTLPTSDGKGEVPELAAAAAPTRAASAPSSKPQKGCLKTLKPVASDPMLTSAAARPTFDTYAQKAMKRSASVISASTYVVSPISESEGSKRSHGSRRVTFSDLSPTESSKLSELRRSSSLFGRISNSRGGS
jgi:hypothetical protein